jgi:hypothetical protein
MDQVRDVYIHIDGSLGPTAGGRSRSPEIGAGTPGGPDDSLVYLGINQA